MLYITEDMDCFKLYLSDIGLFTTMLFNDSQNGIEDIYKKLLSDTLPTDLEYLYENVVAQAIRSSGRDLYYHTWKKEESTHFFEIDCYSLFLSAAFFSKRNDGRSRKRIDSFTHLWQNR